jgi:hypothetical protein
MRIHSVVAKRNVAVDLRISTLVQHLVVLLRHTDVAGGLIELCKEFSCQSRILTMLCRPYRWFKGAAVQEKL